MRDLVSFPVHIIHIPHPLQLTRRESRITATQNRQCTDQQPIILPPLPRTQTGSPTSLPGSKTPSRLDKPRRKRGGFPGVNAPLIGRIIHVITDRIHSGEGGTTVLPHGTAHGARGLLWRIIDIIARVGRVAGIILPAEWFYVNVRPVSLSLSLLSHVKRQALKKPKTKEEEIKKNF